MRNPESDIKDAIRGVFVGTPIIVWNHPTGVAVPVEALRDIVDVSTLPRITYGLVGSSDLIGLLPTGKFLGIEVKTPTGRLSPEQKRFAAMVRRQGGVYIEARSPQDVREALFEYL